MAETVFTDGTVYTQSRLDMINTCLLAIGERPLIEGTLVESLPIGTEGDTARRIIEKVMVQVQKRGWYFNTDYDFKLVPDSNNFIAMPPNTLRVDFEDPEFKHRYTIKNGKIYDYKKQTFKIESSLVADVIWLVDYENLPIEAYEYISLRAAKKFQQTLIGSQELYAFTQLDETEAKVDMERVELQSRDYNMLNHKVSTRTHNANLNPGLYRNQNRRNY